MRSELSVLCLAALLAGCAGARSVPEPAPAPTTAPAAPAAIPPSAHSAAVSPAKTAEAPAPLRAGSDGGFPASADAARPSACAADTIRRTLEEVVAQCKREGAPRICGELKVRASEDGKSIRVTLDIAKDNFDDSFSRCITSRLNGVAWRCTLPGSDTTLDLGCDL